MKTIRDTFNKTSEKNVSKTINKTMLALLLSVVGASASMSAIANISNDINEEHRVEITRTNGQDVSVFVNANGAITDIKLTNEQIEDKAKLAKALADVPVDVREQIIDSLSGESENIIRINTDDDNKNVHWVSDNGDEKIIVVEIEEDGKTDEKHHKIIKHFKNGEEIKELKVGFEGSNTERLIRMINKGKFSSDDLNKLQQALDAKR